MTSLLGAAMLSDTNWRDVAKALRISGRELQIVHGIFDNRTEHAIAADLHIADCTVHTHLNRLYKKLGVTTRVELVLRVIETFLKTEQLVNGPTAKILIENASFRISNAKVSTEQRTTAYR
jgi:DNA-binding CsgD family transcriptional regulator